MPSPREPCVAEPEPAIAGGRRHSYCGSRLPTRFYKAQNHASNHAHRRAGYVQGTISGEVGTGRWAPATGQMAHWIRYSGAWEVTSEKSQITRLDSPHSIHYSVFTMHHALCTLTRERIEHD